MKQAAKILRGLTLLTQLGLSVAAPPLLLIWLATLAQRAWGLGSWIMAVAIVVGLISAGCGAYQFGKSVLNRKREDDEPPSFNQHI